MEKDKNDMLIAPIKGIDGRGSMEEIKIETLESQDLEIWFSESSCPKSNPNFAVCLNQQIHLNQEIPGPQTGLLLKQIAKQGEAIYNGKDWALPHEILACVGYLHKSVN